MLFLTAFTVSFKNVDNLPKFSNYAGFPEIPFKVIIVHLNPDERVEGIKIKSLKQRPINYKITFALPIDTPNAKPIKTFVPDIYPKDVVFVGNQGFFRGHNIAFIVVSAIQIKNGRVFLNEEVDFEVIKGGNTKGFSKPKYSNPEIWAGTFKALGINEYSTFSFIPQDRVDFVILTTESLKPNWLRLAEFRNSMGIKTEVFTFEWVVSHFPGNSIPERIRNFLRYMYENFGLSALLIGADAQRIPPLRTNITLFYDTLADPYGQSFRNFLLTDYYYSALDGDWNLNNDEWDGDEGDIFADLFPDIIVGRLPFNLPEEVDNYINSLIEYETNNNFEVPKFAFMGSNLWGDTADPDSADGCLLAMDLANRLTRIPSSQKRIICEHPSAAVRDTLNNFKPVMLFGIGHSNHKVIMTRNSLSAYDALDYRRINELSGFKFIAGWVGCFINDPFSNSIGLEAVKRGKAVASIGATKADFGLSASSIWGVIYDSINTFAGFPYIGLVVNYGKVAYSYVSQYSTLYRYLLMAYNIIGDPFVRVFNDNRQKLGISYTISDTIITFNVVDSVSLSPKPFVKVSLSDKRKVVAYGFTDFSGRVSFKVKRTDTLNWGVWHPGSLVYLGEVSANYNGYYLVIDSVYLSSPNDTANLTVWIKNLGSSTTTVSPILTSSDLMPISTPSPASIPPRGSTPFVWTVVRSPFSSGNKFSKLKVFMGGYVDSAFIWIGAPRLVFHSAKWRYYSDTLLLMFEVSNSGSDTAFNVRVVVDSSSLNPVGGNVLPRLAPGRFSNYTLNYYLHGTFPYGQWIRLKLYAGSVYYGDYRIRIDTPRVIISGFSSEPVNNGVILRWRYSGDSTKRYSWRVFVDGNPANLDTLTGSNFMYVDNNFVKRRFSVSVVQDGIEGDTVFSVEERPNPNLWFVKDIEYIYFSSIPRYSKLSGPIFGQLLTNTAEPEFVSASAFNRVYALRLDGSTIWQTDLGSWVETFPVIGDVNSDGKLEVVVATTFKLYALNGSNGNVVWSVDYPYFPGRPDSTPTPMYLMLTKAGTDIRIVLITKKGSVLLYNGFGTLLNYKLDSVGDPLLVSPPATYDFDNDGNWEIVVKAGDYLRILDQSLNDISGYPLSVRISRWLVIWDFVRDSVPEILTCGHRNTLVSFSDGIITVDSSAYNPNGICIPVDFDGDDKSDIVMYSEASPYTKVYSIDTQFVAIDTFSEDASLRGRMATTVDIDGDGKGEVLISDARSYLHAYSNIRRDLYGFPIDLSDHNRFRNNVVFSTPSATTYNGYLYIFAPTEANKLYSWRIYGGKVIWGMPFYNRWATNSPIDSLPDEPVLISVKEDKTIKRFDVVFTKGGIKVMGLKGVWLSVYSISGRKALSVYVDGDREIPLSLPKGVYMVKVGSKVFKFIKR